MSASLWAQYKWERESVHTLETAYGFLTYKFNGEECTIYDIFVTKEHRRSGVAWKMADEVSELALSKGCKFLGGFIHLNLPGAQESLKAHLAYGFRVDSANNDCMIVIKDLGGK